MIPLKNNQSNQLINSVCNIKNENKMDGTNKLVKENILQPNSHNEDLKAYETIIQKLHESNEEWWLVSSENEDKGYAYRQPLTAKK